ncbi:hypothetical protein GCM10017044_28860 [Kordiimonas sediminis]|uniref:Uncharacterized protein n=1 Tax=Kordiimonas sediminis TaxID=1735581 RepID=A0A919EB70_9PROT|nr:hypothetical protein GCM10017044_28860 [Kordiimonas sediminis]
MESALELKKKLQEKMPKTLALNLAMLPCFFVLGFYDQGLSAEGVKLAVYLILVFAALISPILAFLEISKKW